MKKSGLKHIPNLLTLLRLLLCPFIVFLFVRGRFKPAGELFILACVTDFFDGYLARRLDARTPLGEILDPVCDKIFALAFFCLLMTLGICPPWFLGLLISVALFQGLGIVLVKASKAAPRSGLGSLPLGKWNMTLQFVWIGLLLLEHFVLHHNEPPSVALGFAHELGYLSLGTLQIVVFLRYFQHFRNALAPHFRPLARLA